MSDEKPEALKVADGVEFCPEPYKYAAGRLLRTQHAEIERLTADNKRLRGLLREVREYVGYNSCISLLNCIDAALQEPPR